MKNSNYLGIPQVDRVSNLSKEEFLQKYGIPGKPVVILDLMHNWKAKTCWKTEFFQAKYGNIHVDLRRTKTPGDKRTMKLSEYIDYMESTKDEDPYYIGGWGFRNDCSEILEDYSVPEYFKSWHHQLPDKIVDKFGLHWSMLFIGPANSGTKTHIDSAFISSWNAVVYGIKRWFFYPPEDGSYLYDGEVDARNPDLKKYPLYAKASPLTCIQNPGEIVFNPGNWWHQVINEESCISVRESFVNESNYKRIRNSPDFLKELPNTVKQEIEQYLPQFYHE